LHGTWYAGPSTDLQAYPASPNPDYCCQACEDIGARATPGSSETKTAKKPKASAAAAEQDDDEEEDEEEDTTNEMERRASEFYTTYASRVAMRVSCGLSRSIALELRVLQRFLAGDRCDIPQLRRVRALLASTGPSAELAWAFEQHLQRLGETQQQVLPSVVPLAPGIDLPRDCMCITPVPNYHTERRDETKTETKTETAATESPLSPIGERKRTGLNLDGTPDLRTTKGKELAAAMPCKFYHTPGGTCKRGDSCKYMHGPKTDARAASRSRSRSPPPPVNVGQVKDAASSSSLSSSSSSSSSVAAAPAGPTPIESIVALLQHEASALSVFYRQRHPAAPRRFELEPQFSTAVLTLHTATGSFDVLVTGVQALILCVLGRAPRSRAELQAALGCPSAFVADFDCAMSALTAPAHPLVVSTASGLALSDWCPSPSVGASPAPLSLLDAVELCNTPRGVRVHATWRSLTADARLRQQRIDDFDQVSVRVRVCVCVCVCVCVYVCLQV
jgi:hypothetical protein